MSPGQILLIIILAPGPITGGVFRQDIWEDKGIDEILGLVSAALIKHRGAYGTHHPVSVLGFQVGAALGQGALGQEGAFAFTAIS